MDNIYELHYKFLLEFAEEKARKNRIEKGIITDDIKRKYVMYLRRSTKDKYHQERSIKDQKSECEALCNREGIKPVKILIEEESAKKSGKRSIFTEMIEDIKKGRYNSIIAWHPDRLARNMKDGGEIIDLIDNGKIIDLKFPTFTFTRDTNGIMTLGFQFVLAKSYVDNLSTASKRGTTKIVQEGKAPIYPKYGYIKSQERYYRPDGKNFELIRKAFEMGIEGMPYDNIAKYLNDNSFEFKGKKIKMYKQKIADLFSDPFYAGINVYGDTVVELTKIDPLFKSVITPLEFGKLRKGINASKGYSAKQESEILLRGLVHCFYCDNLMTPGVTGNGRGQRYLRIACTNKKCDRFTKKKDGKSIRRDVRAKVIFDKMIYILQNVDIDKEAYYEYLEEMKLLAIEKRSHYEEGLKHVDNKIDEIEKEIDRNTSALAKSTNESLTKRLNLKFEELENNKEQLIERRKNIEQQLTDIDFNLKKKTLSYEKFSNFFKNIVDIILNNENKYVVDQTIRMIFSNFILDDEKVVSYQFNPNIEKYLKLPSVISSRGNKT